MAKIRVYELAKDLNMKNKALMDKLSEMEIRVRSHMSSLDPDTANRIKSEILGKDAVEDRIKPTVIRRRKKRKKPAAEAGPPAAESEAGQEKPRVDDDTPAAAPEPEPSPEAADGSSPSGPAASPEKAADTAEPEAVEAQQPQETEQHPLKTQSKETPAPVASEGSPPVSPPQQVSDSKASAGEKQAPKPAEPSESAADSAAEISEKDEDTVAPQKDQMAPEKARPEPEKSQTEPEKSQTEPVKPDSEKKKPKKADKKKAKPGQKAEGEKAAESKPTAPSKKRKKKKKTKRDSPARIIKRPESQSEETLERIAATSKEGGRPEDEAKPEPEPSRQSKAESGAKKKPAKKATAAEPVEAKKDTKEKDKDKDKNWAKKKISFKKKEVVEGADLYRGQPRSRKGKKGQKGKPIPQPQKPQITTPKQIKRRIKIDDTIVLADLAKRMGIKANEMIKKLMGLGVMVTVNQTIDFDTAALVAAEFGYEVEKAAFVEEEVLKAEREGDTDPAKLTHRPPVVTIMGHVDHGKTSLLDLIRKTRITEEEAGGITQHIGAYNVSTERGEVTFLDTPGHEAFTAMRARGALVTDLVVLVVAADDGVMPQTIEAINHSKAAGVPMVVAVNKIDKANAEPDRVMRELTEQGLVPEDWGGDTIFVQVSAKQNQGIDDLLEMILLQAEVLELKANPDKLATGYVVEAKLDAGRGPVATILIKEGTLRTGEPVVCGVHHGKIRAMLNDRGQQVDHAGPAFPVEILGLSGVPNAGDEMVALSDEKSAKQVSDYRIQKQRSMDLAKTSRMSLEKLFEKMQADELKDLNLIIKADVHGSIEALRDSLTKLSNEEVNIRVIHAAPGTITESDVSLAAVSDAIIIGFNVRPTPKVQAMANEEHVDIRYYNVIYNAIKDIEDAIVGMMESKFEERVLGQAEVRDIFHVPKVGTVAGCYVTNGKVTRGGQARLLREGVVIYDGKISSLKRFKEDAKEVVSGYECGMGLENFNDIKVGDVIECYYLKEIRPELG